MDQVWVPKGNQPRLSNIDKMNINSGAGDTGDAFLFLDICRDSPSILKVSAWDISHDISQDISIFINFLVKKDLGGFQRLPSGKRSHNHGQSPFFTGKSMIFFLKVPSSITIWTSPEGTNDDNPWISHGISYEITRGYNWCGPVVQKGYLSGFDDRRQALIDEALEQVTRYTALNRVLVNGRKPWDFHGIS